MSDDKQYLTQKKMNELVGELEHLKSVRRQEVAEKLEYARSLGDLSENAEYKEARELQGALESRIAEVEHILANAEVISIKKSSEAGIGSLVTIVKIGEKDEREYEIVGSTEANMRERKISHCSPLGSAIMGKKKGQKFEFESPAGVIKYKVVNVD